MVTETVRSPLDARALDAPARMPVDWRALWLRVLPPIFGFGLLIGIWQVIDPRTLVPLDLDAIVGSVRKTHRVVIVHEAHERVGFGAELVAQIVQHAFDYLDAPPVRVANPNVPTPFNRTLEQLSIPSAAQVVQAVRGLMR